jgi:glutamine amidotransferase
MKPTIPHMGWNSIKKSKESPILEGIDEKTGFYFLHSYYFDCESHEDEIATSDYPSPFTCAVQRENIFGMQFHPEKSHFNGVRLFQNFASLPKL